MRIVLLILFTVFTLGASSQVCQEEFESNHCSIELSSNIMDCHSGDSDQSAPDHSGECGCGCHLHSSTPIIITQSVFVTNNSQVLLNSIISLNIRQELSDYKNKINRPPILNS
jgi:hypothetical protein